MIGVTYKISEIVNSIKEVYGKSHEVDFSKLEIHIEGVGESWCDSWCDHTITYNVPITTKNEEYDEMMMLYNKKCVKYRKMYTTFLNELQAYEKEMQVYKEFLRVREIYAAKEILTKNGINFDEL